MLRLDVIVPVLMSCALLWWVGRGMSWTLRLGIIVVTLAIIAGILWFEQTLR